MWEQLKEWLGDIFLIAGALGIGITLALVAVYGAVKVYEANPAVLYAELVWSFLAVALGFERAWRDRPRRK